MKRKVLLLCIAVVTLFSVIAVGCAGPAPTPPEEAAPPPEEEEEAPPAAPEEEVFNWRMAVLYPRGVAYIPLYEMYLDDLKKMSGGRLLVDLVCDGEGVTATEVFDAAAAGLVEMGSPYPALHAGVFPAGVIELGLPGCPPSNKDLKLLFYETRFNDVIKEGYAAHNLYKLDADMFLIGTYLCSKQPVKSLDDIKGMKIRCPGAYGELINNLGGSAVVMAFAEVYTALATGVIDGVDGCNIVDHRDGRFYEVAQYMYPLPLTTSQVAPLIVNMDAWNSLPEDLQAIIEISQYKHAELWERKSNLWELEALTEMLDGGLQWSPEPSEAEKAEWLQAGQASWDKYAEKDECCAELIDIMTDFMKELGF